MMRKEIQRKIDVVHSKKGKCFKAGDNFGKIYNTKPATFLSPEDSHCMNEKPTFYKAEKWCIVLFGS